MQTCFIGGPVETEGEVLPELELNRFQSTRKCHAHDSVILELKTSEILLMKYVGRR